MAAVKDYAESQAAQADLPDNSSSTALGRDARMTQPLSDTAAAVVTGSTV